MEIVFETERLRLREFTVVDAPLLLELNSDPEVVKFIHEQPLKTLEQARNIINHTILPQYKNHLGRWAVHLKEDNAFMGWCGLKYVPEVEETDLGYRFMKKYWGKGFATEAALHTVKYGFNTLHLKAIMARTHIENIASQKVLYKIGFKYKEDAVEFGEPLKIFINNQGHI